LLWRRNRNDNLAAQSRNGYAITPLEGKSLAPHFNGLSNNRSVVYWEHEANIAVRDGKWKLVAKTAEGADLSKQSLALFDMDKDPSEMNDLAAKYPDRLNAMYKEWLTWANKIGAFPLDTRKYGVRMDAYKTSINGNFDDKLGGWTVKQAKSVTGSVAIDTTGQLSGKNSVKVTMLKPGDRHNALAITWNLKADKGEEYVISLTSKANSNTSFYLGFEKPNSEGEEVMNQEITITDNRIKTTSESFKIPENGTYQLGLYFGKLNPGDELWIDDVKLVPVKK
jgi:hypothetical protein